MLAQIWTGLVALGQGLWPTQGAAPCQVSPLERKCPTAAREVLLTSAVAGLVVLFGLSFLLVDPRFFWHDDFQLNYLPGYCDMARAWQAGEFPLLSAYSWHGGALAGEYQYGVFSVFVTACTLAVFSLGLSLPSAAAAIALVHFAVLAAGVFRLVRRLGLSIDLSLLAVLIASLNGWIFMWGGMVWIPALVSFAWLPWFWWALDRSFEGRAGLASCVPAGLFLYLLIAAGWPFTVLMAGLLSVWLLLRSWCSGRPWGAIGPLLAAWAVGLGLSAPAWLMLVEFTRETYRGQLPAELTREWVVPIGSLPGLVFPPLIVFWKKFGFAWQAHVNADLSGGFVPLSILGAATACLGRSLLRRLRWELGLCGLVLFLAVNPGLGSFRWSFRWLPFFFLLLGLAAAQALALLRERQTSPAPEDAKESVQLLSNAGIWATFLVLVVWTRALLMGLDTTNLTYAYGLLAVLLSLMWAVVDSRAALTSPLRIGMPCLVLLATSWYLHARAPMNLEVPTWGIDEQVRQAAPLDPQVRYLGVSTWHPDVWDGQEGSGEQLYPGNASLYTGVEFINGYSPIQPLGLMAVFEFEIHGCPTRTACLQALTGDAGADGLLQLMAVDGLVVSEQFACYWPDLEANGWAPVADVKQGRVFHRNGPPSPRVRSLTSVQRCGDAGEVLDALRRRENGPVPLLLLGEGGSEGPQPASFARACITPRSESRHRVEVEVSSPDGESLVLFSRPWYPGYRAMLNGKPLPVAQLNLLMPAVRLPAGAEGTLVLEYRPRALVVGSSLAGATAAGVVCVLLLGWLRRGGRASRAGPAI